MQAAIDNSTTRIQPPKVEPILRARCVRKTYRLGAVDVPVLRGASLEVREGEWVAILGASGSGKSTLLHLLGDLDVVDPPVLPGHAGGSWVKRWRSRRHPSQCPDCGYPIGQSTRCTECGSMLNVGGEIYFRQKPLSEMSAFERNRYRNEEVGFVFQFYHLLPELNVVENALLPGLVKPSLRSRRFWTVFTVTAGVTAALVTMALWARFHPEQVQPWPTGLAIAAGVGAVAAFLSTGVWTEINSLIARFGPEYQQRRQRAIQILSAFGLGHRLRHRPRELSGGERQRVAIARALMNNPQVLLADEPTGNLDEKTGGEILELIAEQHRQGLTIVMVTHDPNIAARADRIVHLQDGRVVEG